MGYKRAPFLIFFFLKLRINIVPGCLKTHEHCLGSRRLAVSRPDTEGKPLLVNPTLIRNVHAGNDVLSLLALMLKKEMKLSFVCKR